VKITVKFTSGSVVSTPGAIEALARNDERPSTFLIRHFTGDWGNLDAHDRAANEAALIPDEHGEHDRILSAYNLHDGTRIWIITEADRSATTILLPDEY